jgi:hypothetical protein
MRVRLNGWVVAKPEKTMRPRNAIRVSVNLLRRPTI